MKNVSVFVSCHKPTELFESELYQPIQLGAKEARQRLEGMIYDDEGENISTLNPMYCEMTAQYYAWKNVNLKYYGFCHYRRYFNFSKERFVEDEYGNVIESYPSSFMV